MRSILSRRLLSSRSRLVQVAAQPFSGWLARTLDREFARAGIDWNGRPSCLLLSFDVDFPEDALALPSIVEKLRPYPIQASFASVGRWVEDYPEPHQAVLEAGYELFNHTYSHPELVNSPRHFVSFRDDFNPVPWRGLSLEETYAEIRRCQETVGQILGYEMKGFRVPHFGNARPDDLYPFLGKIGMVYSSSLLAPLGERFGLPVWKGRILEIPVSTCPHHPYSSFDSWHALHARGGWHRDDFLQRIEERLESAVGFHGLTCMYLDPKDQDRLDFDRLFAFIASLEEVCWVPSYSEFARWYRDRHPPEGEETG